MTSKISARGNFGVVPGNRHHVPCMAFIVANSESQELYELWEETEAEDFNEWKQEVEDLAEALSDLLK